MIWVRKEIFGKWFFLQRGMGGTEGRDSLANGILEELVQDITAEFRLIVLAATQFTLRNRSNKWVTA